MKKFTGALISRNPKSACKKRQLLQSFLLSYSKHYFTGSTVRSTLYSLLIKNNTRIYKPITFIQMTLIKKPINRLLPIFSPDFTLCSQIRLFYAEKWIFLRTLGTLLNSGWGVLSRSLVFASWFWWNKTLMRTGNKKCFNTFLVSLFLQPLSGFQSYKGV